MPARIRTTALAVAFGLSFARVPARAQEPPASCRTASDAYQQGRVQEAVAAFRECVAAVPGSPGVLSDYGAALAAAGAYDEALEQYARALALAPGHPAIRRNMALAYYKSGRPAEAARRPGASLDGDLVRQLLQRIPVPKGADAHRERR